MKENCRLFVSATQDLHQNPNAYDVFHSVELRKYIEGHWEMICETHILRQLTNPSLLLVSDVVEVPKKKLSVLSQGVRLVSGFEYCTYVLREVEEEK